jgi:predicted HicB family RNase H-like nuclease
MSEKKDQFDGFTINLVEESKNEWLAHFVELPGVSAYGDTTEEALAELAIVWQGMKESYVDHGNPIPIAPSRKKYSGQFNVRVDKELHRTLASEAEKIGISLNALVAKKLLLATNFYYEKPFFQPQYLSVNEEVKKYKVEKKSKPNGEVLLATGKKSVSIAGTGLRKKTTSKSQRTVDASDLAQAPKKTGKKTSFIARKMTARVKSASKPSPT